MLMLGVCDRLTKAVADGGLPPAPGPEAENAEWSAFAQALLEWESAHPWGRKGSTTDLYYPALALARAGENSAALAEAAEWMIKNLGARSWRREAEAVRGTASGMSGSERGRGEQWVADWKRQMELSL
jgi:hypothetical protein